MIERIPQHAGKLEEWQSDTAMLKSHLDLLENQLAEHAKQQACLEIQCQQR